MSEINTANIPVASIEDDLKFLLGEAKIGYQSFKLPSNSPVLYSKYECNGTVNVRPLKVKDEIEFTRILSNKDKSSEAVEQMLRSCVEGHKEPRALTIPDKLFLLFKIRELSIGDEYVLESACNYCKTSNKITLKLSEVPVNYRPTPMESFYGTITLPQSEVEIKFRCALANDEQYFTTETSFLENLYRFIVSVSKGGKTFTLAENTTLIEKLVLNLKASEALLLSKAIFDDSYGLQNKFIYSCQSCKKDNTTRLELNSNFM
jgi:hypothetical protein